MGNSPGNTPPPSRRPVSNPRATMSTPARQPVRQPARQPVRRELSHNEGYPPAKKIKFVHSSYPPRDQDDEMSPPHQQFSARPRGQTSSGYRDQVSNRTEAPLRRTDRSSARSVDYDSGNGEDEGYLAAIRDAPYLVSPSPFQGLRPSRFAGGIEPHNVNQDPPVVSHDQVSDASLAKRGLKRGKDDKVCKRGYGANDPENIEIVNLREHHNLAFDEISKILNNKRIANGKNPTLSATGCTSRYNRTAPLMFAAQGIEFIPLSKRERGSKVKNRLPFTSQWNDRLDNILVNIVKEVDTERWEQVRERFVDQTEWELSIQALATRWKNL